MNISCLYEHRWPIITTPMSLAWTWSTELSEGEVLKIFFIEIN